MSDGLLGSASSIPATTPVATDGQEAATDPHRWGGDAEPNELLLAIMKAHRGWAKKYHSHLLEEWLDA